MECGRKSAESAGQNAERADRNRSYNPEDCSVCLTPFDDTEKRPRTMPCGHTLCTPCINKLNVQGHVVCPTCRVRHAVPQDGQFPVSYALEALIKRQMDMEEEGADTPHPKDDEKGDAATKSVQGEEASLSNKMRYFLKEQEVSVLTAMNTCRNIQLQLDQYQKTLSDWNDEQQHLEDKVQSVIDQSRRIRMSLQQEESKAADKHEQMKEREQQLHAVLQNIRMITREKEVGATIVNSFRCIDEAEQTVEECQGMLSDESTATNARKVREISSAAVDAVLKVKTVHETNSGLHAAAEVTRLQVDQNTIKVQEVNSRAYARVQTETSSSSTVCAAIQTEQATSRMVCADVQTERMISSSVCTGVQTELAMWTTPLPLKVEDSGNLRLFAGRLVDAGLVFAVHKVGDRNRQARISSGDGRLYLHCLQTQSLPLGASTVKVSEVVVLPPPCHVFLDLAWPGSAPQRVHIRLSPDNPRGRQFVLMCTGQCGPSYVNTKLCRVWNKGKSEECVIGGDYEKNDGTGGAALMTDLNEGESQCAGAVTCIGWSDPDRFGAQFAISTKDLKGNRKWNVVFGEVVEGLDAVAAAAQHRDISEVNIVDCGVVLWGSV